MQIADNAERFRLLRVVHVHSVLRGYGVNYPIWQAESWRWSSRWRWY